MMRMLFAVLLLMPKLTLAHHPGERLDQVMAGKEPAFEAIDRLLPPGLELTGPDGARIGFENLSERIVVLSFVPARCGAACDKPQTMLAAVQAQINVTPMSDMVTFLTVRDPGVSFEAPWDDANWKPMTPSSETSAQALADRFAAMSARDTQMPTAHVIDRGGRHAAIFHGPAFSRINMVLYINGLTNAPHRPKKQTGTGWRDSQKGAVQ